MALAHLDLICAAGQQPHHRTEPVSVEALTLAKAAQIARARMGWHSRKGQWWCGTCWTLRHQSG